MAGPGAARAGWTTRGTRGHDGHDDGRHRDRGHRSRRAAPGAARTCAPVAAWVVTRAVLLLCVLQVWVVPGPDVTVDVSVIYRDWYGVLSTGAFPADDVTWQYPPAAALAVLSPPCCRSSRTRTPSSSWCC